jgi:hypothetical protein
MSNPKRKLWDAGDGILCFECPGCKFGHAVHTEKPNESGAKWTWNGSWDAPTFSPSVFSNPQSLGEYPKCHSFIRDGKIQFLSDSTHALAGQTVELPFAEI